MCRQSGTEKWSKLTSRRSFASRLLGRQLAKQLCDSCSLLPVDGYTIPYCRVCFQELPAGIDENHEPEEIRFQKYLLEGMRLNSMALTRARLSEGLCPYINRTAASRLRALRLREEDLFYSEYFKQKCRE